MTGISILFLINTESYPGCAKTIQS